MDKKYCVIVDAYSTSAFLADEFIKRGFACIHVTSPGEKAEYYSKTFRSNDFNLIVQVENLECILNMLKSLPIVSVVAGTDVGGATADHIATHFHLPQNDPKLVHARRYKDLMAERLAAVRLPHISHIKSADEKEIIDWANKNNHWPIIIKPTDGAATEGLSICHHADEVEYALYLLFNTKSFLGHQFRNAIAQPFIEGKEYIVNTVSCEGQHYVTDIWESRKVHQGPHIIYDTMVLLPSQGEIQQTLIDYALKVNDALGIKVGPVHSELILGKKGPILIEANCRPMGLSIPLNLQNEALDHTQVSLTAEALIASADFIKHTREAYRLKKHLACVLHQVPYENAFVNTEGISLIKELPSFRMHKFAHLGAVAQTVDLLTSPGWVLLIHEDSTVIEQDIARIREIERDHLFMVNPPLCVP